MSAETAARVRSGSVSAVLVPGAVRRSGADPVRPRTAWAAGRRGRRHGPRPPWSPALENPGTGCCRGAQDASGLPCRTPVTVGGSVGPHCSNSPWPRIPRIACVRTRERYSSVTPQLAGGRGRGARGRPRPSPHGEGLPPSPRAGRRQRRPLSGPPKAPGTERFLGAVGLGTAPTSCGLALSPQVRVRLQQRAALRAEEVPAGRGRGRRPLPGGLDGLPELRQVRPAAWCPCGLPFVVFFHFLVFRESKNSLDELRNKNTGKQTPTRLFLSE